MDSVQSTPQFRDNDGRDNDGRDSDTPAPSNIVAAPYRFRPWHLPLYLFLVVGAAIALAPLLWMVTTSFMTLGETIQRHLLPATLQWQNYQRVLTSANFALYFRNSVIIATLTISGMIVTSTLAAYAFARIAFFGRDVIFVALLTTLMVPEVVTFIPSFLIIRGDIVPLPGGSWLNSLQALTVPFMASAFNIFLLRQFFRRIPWELWDAARIDGSGHLRFLLRVVVPMSTAPVMTVALLSFIASWNAFMWPLLVTDRDTWRPLTVGLFRFNNEAGPETHLIMAASLITVLPVLVLYFFTQKQFTDAFASSGLKG